MTILSSVSASVVLVVVVVEVCPVVVVVVIVEIRLVLGVVGVGALVVVVVAVVEVCLVVGVGWAGGPRTGLEHERGSGGKGSLLYIFWDLDMACHCMPAGKPKKSLQSGANMKTPELHQAQKTDLPSLKSPSNPNESYVKANDL